MNYEPHENQIPIHLSSAKYKCVVAGRQFGKSRAAAAELIDKIGQALSKGQKLRAAWIAPTYKNAEAGLNAIKAICEGTDILTIKGRAPYIATFFGRVDVPFLSTERPDSIRGQTYDYIIIDECDFISDIAWNEVIQPTILTTKGTIFCISTPKRHGSWFYKLYHSGSNHVDTFHFTSYQNPYADEDFLELQKQELPSMSFQQEYLAKWIEGGNAFPNLANVLRTEKSECPHNTVVIGLDLAKQNDYTVILALCKDCGEVIGLHRFNQIDWNVQVEQIIDVSKRYNPVGVYMDHNSIGDVVYDLMRKRVQRLKPVRITAKSKKEMIHGLQWAIDNSKITINKNHVVLISELQTYELCQTRTSYTFNASGSNHDDCVIALALAVQGAKLSRNTFVPQIRGSETDEEREERMFNGQRFEEDWIDNIQDDFGFI